MKNGQIHFLTSAFVTESEYQVIALTQLGIITYDLSNMKFLFPCSHKHRAIDIFSVYTYGHVYFLGDGWTLRVLIFPCHYFKTS